MTNIATITDVFNLTGAVVTDVEISQAQGLIESLTGLVLDPEDTDLYPWPPEDINSRRLRDQRLVRNAVCYQTVWMKEHPDVFARMSATSLSQDGLSVSVDHEDAWMVAPLARRTLSGTSWSGDRTTHTSRPRRPFTMDQFTWNDDHPWYPSVRGPRR